MFENLRHTISPLIKSHSTPGKALWTALQRFWPNIRSLADFTKPQKLAFQKVGGATLSINTWNEKSHTIMYEQNILLGKIAAYSGFKQKLTLRFVKLNAPPHAAHRTTDRQPAVIKPTTLNKEWSNQQVRDVDIKPELKQALEKWGALLHHRT